MTMKKACKNIKNNFKSFLFDELSEKELNQDFAKYHILPIPLEKTITFGKGTKKGPKAIIRASNELERLSEKSEPCSNGIFTYQPIKCSRPIEETLNEVEKTSFNITKNNKIPIGIGGEHSLTYGMLKGIKNALMINSEEIGIIQIDAHADLRENYMGQKHSHASVMYLLAKENFKIFQIGVRAISKEEIKNRTKFNINFIENKILKTKEKWKNLKLPENFPKKIYISFDADGLDPSIMPATGTPVPKGINYEDIFKILSILTKGREILGFDLVEFSPIKNIPAYDFIAASIVYDLMEIVEINS